MRGGGRRSARRRLARAREALRAPSTGGVRHDRASMSDERRTSLAPAEPRADRPAALPARRSSPSARSPTGAAPSASRALIDRTLVDFLYRLLVPLRGRGHRARPGRRRRPAGLQPLRRAAARRDDDRQGDQGGAPAPAAAAPHRRALLQGLSAASACCCRRSAASPRTRPTSTACCYDEEQLVLVFPEGRKGTEKLYKDRYRLRRFGRGGFVEAAMRARRADRPGLRRRRRGGRADLRPARRRCRSSPACIYFPLTPTFPHFGLLGDARLPAGEVPHPLPRADPDRRVRATSPGGQGARCRPSPRRSARGSRRTSTRWSPSASRCGSGERQLPARPDHRAVDLLGRPARAGARAGSEQIEAIIGVDRAPADGRAASAPSSSTSPTQHSLIRRIVARRRDRHGRRHPPGASTRSSRSAAPRAREQRHRDDERPRGLRRRRTRRSRKFVFKLQRHYYGCEQDDPAFFTEAMRARTRRARRSSATSSRPRRPSREFAASNPEVDA